MVAENGRKPFHLNTLNTCYQMIVDYDQIAHQLHVLL